MCELQTTQGHERPHLWVLTFICLTALAAGGCGENAPSLEGPMTPGRRVYLERGCGVCHGLNREGTRSAPALTELNEGWTPELLTEFLVDPEATAEQHLWLRYRRERYRTKMPKGALKTQEELRLVVAFLLGNEPS